MLKGVQKKSNYRSTVRVGYAVFNVSFHRRFRIAVWKFVTWSNLSSKMNFAGKGTKEGLFKQTLGTHYAEISKTFLCTDFTFFERHIQMGTFSLKQPIFASNLNLV